MARIPRLAGLAWACLALLQGCPDDPPGLDEEAQGDLERLQRALIADRVPELVREVEEVAAERKPVLAGQLLEDSALPVAREEVERWSKVEVATRLGRALRSRGVRVLRQRVEALEQYALVLSKGEGDDLALLDVLRARRKAQEALLELHDALAEHDAQESREVHGATGP